MVKLAFLKNLSTHRTQWGKGIVMCMYILVIFAIPLIFSIPPIDHYLSQKNDESMVPQNVDDFFQNYIAMMKAGDVQKAYSLLTKEVQSNISTSTLTTLSDSLASTTGQSTFVGYSVYYDEGPTRPGTLRTGVFEFKNNDQQYHYNNYVLIEITTVDTPNGLKIYGFHIQFNPNSANNVPLFDFSQSSNLFLAITIPLFIIYTAGRYLRFAVKPTWWIFLIILFGSLTFVDSNGVYQILVAFGSFVRQGTGLNAATIIYSVPIPIGALVYYIYRKKVEIKSGPN